MAIRSIAKERSKIALRLLRVSAEASMQMLELDHQPRSTSIDRGLSGLSGLNDCRSSSFVASTTSVINTMVSL